MVCYTPYPIFLYYSELYNVICMPSKLKDTMLPKSRVNAIIKCIWQCTIAPKVRAGYKTCCAKVPYSSDYLFEK